MNKLVIHHRKKVYLFSKGVNSLWIAICAILIVYFTPATATIGHNKTLLQQTVTGTVKGTDGEPIVGASVQIQGTTTSVATDKDGKYTIRARNGQDILLFSYMGYISKGIPISGRKIVDAVLERDTKELKEVVVTTALGIERSQRSLGYAVSEVKMDSVTKANEPNFINSLAGKVPGLIVTQSAGGPMGSSRVIIRGNTTLSGDNQPLYVIDGIPIENTNMGDVGGGKFAGAEGASHDMGDVMSSLNPDDIESISILKGPSAAALYGSMASNGVIMITMKKGKQGKVAIEFNNTSTLETQATKFNNVQRIYGQGLSGSLPTDETTSMNSVFSNWGPRFDPNLMVIGYDGVERPYVYSGDGLSAFLRTGQSFTNSISMSQSINKSSFRLAYTNLTTDDIVPNTGMDRHSFNLGSTTRINNQLSLDTRIVYMYEAVKNRPAIGDAVDNIAKSFFGLASNIDPRIFSQTYKNEFGEYVEWGGGRYNYNPYWVINDMENNTSKNRLLGSLTANYSFAKYFKLRLMGSVDQNSTAFRKYSPVTSPNALLGGLEDLDRNIITSQADAMLSFDKMLSPSFRLTSRVGVNYYNFVNKGFSNMYSRMTVREIVSPNSFTDRSVNEFYSRKVKNSVYGVLALAYKNYAFLDATFRRDASSTLPINNNTYSYPSLSGSFVFTDAFNMPDFISSGKLRVSAAEVGSDTNPYMLDLTYQLYPLTFNGEASGGIAVSTIPNRELKPTRTRSFETGLDLKFFNDRLGLDFTYYTSRSRDQINTVPAPQSSGFTRQIVNVGTISNKGYEIALNAKILSKTKFKWNAQFNIARNINIVESLAEGLPFLTLAEARWLGVSVVAMPGQPYGSIMGFNYQYDPDGNVILDPSTRRPLQSETKQLLGKGIYDWTGGFMNSFSYKNFSLSISLDIKQGADVFSMTNMYYIARGHDNITLEGRDEWIQSENDRAAAAMTSAQWLASGNQRGFVPKGVIRTVDANGNFVYTPNEQGISPNTYWQGYVIDGQGVATPFIYDASYVKIRDMALSYRLKPTLSKKIGLEDVVFGFVVRNPWIIRRNVPNIDPDSNTYTGNGQGLELGALPQRRGFGLNLKVKF